MSALRKHIWILKGIVAVGLTAAHFFPQHAAHAAFLVNMLWLFAF